MTCPVVVNSDGVCGISLEFIVTTISLLSSLTLPIRLEHLWGAIVSYINTSLFAN